MKRIIRIVIYLLLMALMRADTKITHGVKVNVNVMGVGCKVKILAVDHQ